MTENAKIVISFCIGAVVGGVASWKFLKKYYQKEADDQVKSVIDAFDRNEKEKETELDELRSTVEKYEKEDYKNMVNDLYHPANFAEQEHPSEEDYLDVIRISLDEVGNDDSYEVRHMTWYPRQGILTTEDDVPVEDPRYYVFDINNLRRFNDLPGEEIYLRNEKICYDMIIEISEDDYVE